jgi:hypothetical protein
VQSPHSCSEVVVTDVGGDGVRSLAAVLMRMVTERVRIQLPGRFAFDALWPLWASGPPWVAERAAAVSRSWPSPSPGGGARLVPGCVCTCSRQPGSAASDEKGVVGPERLSGQVLGQIEAGAGLVGGIGSDTQSRRRARGSATAMPGTGGAVAERPLSSGRR